MVTSTNNLEISCNIIILIFSLKLAERIRIFILGRKKLFSCSKKAFLFPPFPVRSRVLVSLHYQAPLGREEE